MQIIRNLNQIKATLPFLALTIGNFDGVHLGHLAILSEIKKIAKEKNLATAVLTFEPHPVTFLEPEKPADFRINSLAQKLKILQKQQIDFVIIVPFNKNFSEILADEFVKKVLLQKLQMKHLVIGYDFIFGRNRQGNFKLLEAQSKKYGFDLSEIAAIKNRQQTCSSSMIRKLIFAGKIAEANQFLTENFAICGIISQGKKMAFGLGFPTINLATRPHIIKPKFGVYKTTTFLPHLNRKFSSITNFGIRPTFKTALHKTQNAPLFETHILNFSQEIYGKKAVIEFLDFIREEKKFSSTEELRHQVKNDIFKLLET
jgi:riboflavin kinase/FMN adenylyltransferase